MPNPPWSTRSTTTSTSASQRPAGAGTSSLYEGCEIAPEAWERFAARGKHANITYGLGTVRVHPSERTRETIRSRAERETFRANIFDTRDQAMFALGEMRKRREIIGAATADAYLRVQDIHLNFGGVKALTGVSFQVHRGEITSIIGPNGAGKTSMINVISGFYRPTRGRIFFDGADRTHLPAHRSRAWDSRAPSRTSRSSRA